MRELPITGYTGLTCLLGHPAKHSISPAMHNEAFHYHGLDYVYLAFDVEEDRFEQAFSRSCSRVRVWCIQMKTVTGKEKPFP